MRQLIQNLLTNALKFRREATAPEISIDGVVRNGTAEITVRDNGIGFDPQYSDRIFRVFERLHGRSEYDGTGIGLALCRKIGERHGGTVIAQGVPQPEPTGGPALAPCAPWRPRETRTSGSCSTFVGIIQCAISAGSRRR